MEMVQSEARFIVALHIRSDSSGFAYACKSDPNDTLESHNGADGPRGHVAKVFTKTLSAIYYDHGYAVTATVKSWGDAARIDYESDVNLKRQQPMSEVGTYFESFDIARKSSTALSQNGFTLSRVISDYLRHMGYFIMEKLQSRYGSQVSEKDVEWCVTLAHDWGDHAMKLMKTSMERSGLVRTLMFPDGSPYPLRFVPELDAASYHCLRESGGSHIKVGDKLLVADLGYKSCHIRVQEVHSVERSKFEMKQVAESGGVLDGRKQFYKILMEILMARMLTDFGSLPVQGNALEVYAFKRICHSALKKFSWARSFDFDKNDGRNYKIELPIDAQNRWKQFDVKHGIPVSDSYDVIKVSYELFERAVKPYLDECVARIARQLLSTPDVKAILVVGELRSLPAFIAKIIKDLNSPVKVVPCGLYTAEGAVAMLLDQVLPFTWKGGGKLSKVLFTLVLPFMWKGGGKVSKDRAVASSSLGNGIIRQTSSPKTCEVLPGRGSTSLSLESSNVLGGGEGSEPSLEKKPSNSRIEGVVKKYSWHEVLLMTNDLTSKILGKGGFGTVYLGKFENGKEVAVKVLNQSSQEGKLETFVNEVNLLIQVNHVNLVKLLGYCQEKRNVVIYEYAEEGSIGDHLHGDKIRLNDWKQRLSIMLQVAYGVDYLHSLCNPTIIHRDIKSENILLTKNMVAKVADFGISKLMGVDDVDMKTHLTTKVIGSLWYIDPEYHETGQLRQSSDVYSFGIVLLEMISGRKPSGIGAWVNKLYGSGGGGAIKAIVDSSLSGNYNPQAMKLVIEVAISCIDADGTSRPMMGEVVGELKKAQSIEVEEKKPWFSFVR